MTWLFALLPLAVADEPVDVVSPDDEEAMVVEVEADRLDYLTTNERAAAEPSEMVSKKRLRWFQPLRSRMTPVNAQIDYTAYTLEPGEVRLGLGTLGIGLLPGTQVSTMVPLHFLGVPNATVKVAVPMGPVSLSLRGDGYWMPQSDFSAGYWQGQLQVSVVPVPALGLHLGGSYAYLDAKGDLDLRQINPLLTDGLDAIGIAAEDVTLPKADAQAHVVSLRAAVDVRFNRRDSIVLQGQTTLWADIDAPTLDDLPDLLFFDEVVAHDGFIPVTEAYTASIAYQLSWKNLNVRAGVGLSSTPGAWILQSVDVAWRFGGATRLRETAMRRGWRQNRRVLNKERRSLRRQARSGGETELALNDTPVAAGAED